MDNLLAHIILPKGFRLTNGQTLKDDADLAVIGSASPFYASVEQVRLEGGSYLRKLSDFAIACQIWQASKNADAASYNIPPAPTTPYSLTDTSWKQYNLFLHARNNFVALQAAFDSIQNVFDIAGTRGSLTLGNLSVGRMAFGRDESLPKKLNSMEDEIKKWQKVINSGGQIGFGGHPKATMAAKGMFDIDAPAGRLWINTGGMGANHKTIPGWGSGGKPVKFGTPSFFNFRPGRNFGSYVSILPRMGVGW